MKRGAVEAVRRRRLVVVGGGLAGLASAHHALALDPDLDVVVLEAEGRLGGRLRSEARGGFVFEGGPIALPGTTEVRRLLDALALPAVPVTIERRLYHGGRLHAAPGSVRAFWRDAPLPRWARLRALAEPLVGRGVGEESVHDFLARRFGRTAAEVFAAPSIAEVSAGDPRRVSLDAAFPRWRRIEERYGSLLRGMARANGRMGGGAGSWVLPGGSEQLPVALAAALGGRVHLEARVVAVEVEPGGPQRVWIEHPLGRVAVEGDALVLAVPAFVAGALLRTAVPAAAEALAGIPYADVVTAGYGFAPGDVSGWVGGVIVARGEGVRALAVQRGEGATTLRWLGGGVTDPGLIAASDEEVDVAARADLRRLHGIVATPRARVIGRWPRGLPNFELGHERRVETARQALLLHGAPIALAGDYLEGAGVEDVLRSARGAVGAVMGVPRV